MLTCGLQGAFRHAGLSLNTPSRRQRSDLQSPVLSAGENLDAGSKCKPQDCVGSAVGEWEETSFAKRPVCCTIAYTL